MRMIRILVPCGMAWALALAADARAELALQKVMLSTGGVAYVEYATAVDGAATLGLDVPLAQVDDILKSLVVFDSAGGVGGFSLPGRDDAQAFAELPFGPEVLASPLAYLNALRGVVLEVRGARPMTGRLLQAETVTETLGGEPSRAVARTRVSLMADDGLRQFILEDSEAVQVADPALRARIARALDALRQQSGSTSRHITLQQSGAGSRTLRVGYVTGAPLWKTSYRLVLPEGEGRARLQGWAVLENTTGADWSGVELALQYGNPVTFRQALYRSYFVTRPEVPVEVLGRLLPNVDSGAVEAKLEAMPPPPAPAPSQTMRSMVPRPAPAAAPMAAPAEAAAASEGAQETVFVLPGRVTLAAGHTASVPILDREVPASRVFLVQPGRPHPLAAIRVANDSPTSLPAGVLTLYDPASPASFAGDARLGGLPAGESRLLSFAEDLRTQASWAREETAAIAGLTAAGGVLRIDERLRTTSRVTLTAPAGEARSLLVEMPRPPGATQAADNAQRAAEETATAWRYAVTLAAGETRVLAVASERITRQSVSLLQDDAVVARVLARPGLPPAAAAALGRLADLRRRSTEAEAARQRIDSQIEQVDADETRIRANLAAVPANDALHGRLLRQLDAAETRIEGLRKAAAQAETAAEQAQQALSAAIGSFSL